MKRTYINKVIFTRIRAFGIFHLTNLPIPKQPSFTQISFLSFYFILFTIKIDYSIFKYIYEQNRSMFKPWHVYIYIHSLEINGVVQFRWLLEFFFSTFAFLKTNINSEEPDETGQFLNDLWSFAINTVIYVSVWHMFYI